MSDPYGATYDEWTHWANTLLLRKDLLPVVCRPGCTITSGSKLKEYGKVPSLYNMHGQVSGIAKWTSKSATVDEVRAWRKQSDYGICLQTRNVRALDVDVEDAETAAIIRAMIHERWDFVSVRTRNDSTKFLVLFTFAEDTPLGKRMMKVPGGLIEFLADGQQCLVAGTHPKGSRYEWEEGAERFRDATPAPVGTTLQEFNDFWHDLDLALALEPPSEARPRTIRGTQLAGDGSDERAASESSGGDAHAPLVDDIAVLLAATGRVTGETSDGRIYFTCPWQHEHTKTSDITETVYFKAGTGGFDRGHFSCLHAHCAGRTDADFLDAIGWTLRGFDDLTVGSRPVVEHEGDGPESDATLGAFGLVPGSEGTHQKVVEAEAPPLAVVGRNIKTGLIPSTSQNLVIALEREDVTGLTIRYDAFTGRLLYGPNAHELSPIRDHDYTEIGLRLSSLMFDPKIQRHTLRDAVRLVGFRRQFDSGLDWAAKLPVWDGVSRIERFYPDYLGTEDSPYTRALGVYQWTAMAGRLLQPGIKADMAPVWIGPQGTGKTSAVKALVVSEDHYVEVNLSDDHKDLARTMSGKLVGELSELRGIRGRDLEWTKAFITRQVEEWVPKFQEERTSYPRRLIFIGTSNREDFLIDATGNRRWLPVAVGDRQRVEAIVEDRLQLWAEGIARFSVDGIVWSGAQHHGRGEHHKYTVGDIWEEPVGRFLWEAGVDGVAPIQRAYITTWEILRDCLHHESKQASQFSAIRVAGILRKYGFEEKEVMEKGRRIRAWVQTLL